ncbi:type I-E CRISPR-associated protein Cas6/Cse3/CasE [Streptomyces sp. HUAS TT20]|uniref:type I-E CRISPR-associated protein Cas6/Cse3/CasE n=1 Tax=Streptomyces sp. HUAS TT20 TaxID=3447509 RepID=UPI0021D80392|nr:type I-E CRISPR-associated protein Cas6/Cse3/CasE [Streptomyces sp. HUAS 15-9]UXY32449.1 type I-E CRISPR-associated protein Cas6/Cse3/CasE [Streptomyces sp. HUAS 15-9]
MPYLSKIALNPRRSSALALLSNPHRLHAAVQGGLAVQPVTERVLWRLETNTAHRAEVLVLTASRPSWEHLVEQAGWPGADGGQPLIADYTPLLQRIAQGREFAFRLTANPVQSVQRPDKPSDEQTTRLKAGTDAVGAPARHRGFRVAHRTAAQQIGWLLHQASRHGFTIPTADTPEPAPGLSTDTPLDPAPAVTLTARDTLRFTKRTNGPRVTVSTATFQGRLRVTDPDALRNALLAGIGPAKGYGQGLLTLAPLPAEAPGG